MSGPKPKTSFIGDGEVQIVRLVKQPIDLYKILKFEGLVGSGGEAKAVIDKGLVILNTAVETQKRKKVFSGDTIEFNGVCYRALCDVPMASTEPDNISQNKNRDFVVSNAKPIFASAVKTEFKGVASKKDGRRAIGIKC